MRELHRAALLTGFAKAAIASLGLRVPVYTKPVYTKPVYTKPVYTKPVYTKPVYTKPVTLHELLEALAWVPCEAARRSRVARYPAQHGWEKLPVRRCRSTARY